MNQDTISGNHDEPKKEDPSKEPDKESLPEAPSSDDSESTSQSNKTLENTTENPAPSTDENNHHPEEENQASTPNQTKNKPKPEGFGSSMIRWLQYFSLGKYYFVIGKENPQPTEQPKPKQKDDLADFKIEKEDKKQSSQVLILKCPLETMQKKVVDFIKNVGLIPLVCDHSVTDSTTLAVFNTITQSNIIVEKKDISFVIAILSNDDLVYPINDKPRNAFMRSNQQMVFNLGYWIGHIGKARVIGLHYDQKRYRIPTGSFDVAYTPFDKKNAWQKELASRLTHVGFTLNNKDSSSS